jgi:hypothetical protein
VRRYERLLDLLSIHPQRRLDQLYSVTTQPNVTDEIAFLNHFRAAHDRQHGYASVVSAKVDSAVLSAAKDAVIRLTACIDVRHVRAVDRNGQSIVPKSRKPYYLSRFLLVASRYPTRQNWVCCTFG